jgi:predicted transcriptional regulator
MGNMSRLQEIIKESGYKKRHIAKELGISHQSFYNRLSGKSEFKSSEISKLCEVISISKKVRDEIFFAN